MKYSTLSILLIVNFSIANSDLLPIDEPTTITKVINSHKNNYFLPSGIGEKFLKTYNSFGFLGTQKNKDLPYQINTINKEIINNQQAIGLEDILILHSLKRSGFTVGFDKDKNL